MKKLNLAFKKLLRIMQKLLGPSGCPWDKEQTHKTLIKYLKEEVGEFEKAVRENDYESMKEELGDILLQVVFHSELARRNKKFTILDVILTLNEKLKRRHPHVFGNVKIKDTEELLRMWKKIKEDEKRSKK